MLTKAQLREIAERAALEMPIKKIETGARAMTEREMWLARRDPPPKLTPCEPERGVTVVIDHLGVEHARNAEGEWLY